MEIVTGPGSIAAWDQIHHEARIKLKHCRAFVLVTLPPDGVTPAFVASSRDMSPEGMRTLLALTAGQALDEILPDEDDEAEGDCAA